MTYWALKGSSLSQKRDNVQKNEKGKYEGGGQGSREGEKSQSDDAIWGALLEKEKGFADIPHSLQCLFSAFWFIFSLHSLFSSSSSLALFVSSPFFFLFFFLSYHLTTLRGDSTMAASNTLYFFLISLFCLVVQVLLL